MFKIANMNGEIIPYAPTFTTIKEALQYIDDTWGHNSANQIIEV